MLLKCSIQTLIVLQYLHQINATVSDPNYNYQKRLRKDFELEQELKLLAEKYVNELKPSSNSQNNSDDDNQENVITGRSFSVSADDSKPSENILQKQRRKNIRNYLRENGQLNDPKATKTSSNNKNTNAPAKTGKRQALRSQMSKVTGRGKRAKQPTIQAQQNNLIDNIPPQTQKSGKRGGKRSAQKTGQKQQKQINFLGILKDFNDEEAISEGDKISLESVKYLDSQIFEQEQQQEIRHQNQMQIQQQQQGQLADFFHQVHGVIEPTPIKEFNQEEEIDIEQQLSSLRQELENLGVDQIDDEYFSEYQLDSYGNYVSNDIEVPSFRGEGPGTRLPSNFVNLIKFCG